LIGLILASSFGSTAFVQAASIDGVIGQDEYASGIHYNFELGTVSGGSWISLASDAEVSMMWNNPDELAVAYKVPFSVNDNFFGDKKLADDENSSLLDNANPWPGAGRDYNALESSDMAQFAFLDGVGGLLFTFQMDYFRDPALADGTYEGNQGYKVDTQKNTWLTFADGTSYDPGTVEFSNTISGMATSLMWNFSATGGGFDFDYMNSPAPGTPGYEGNMIYEFSVNTTNLGYDLGMLIAESHHSPSKLGDESFTPPPSESFTPSPVPRACYNASLRSRFSRACSRSKKKK